MELKREAVEEYIKAVDLAMSTNPNGAKNLSHLTTGDFFPFIQKYL